MIAQSETLIINPIVIITLVSAGALGCCDIYQPCKLCTYVGPNHFLRQIGIFSLFFIQFYCVDHILSTAGDALRTCPAAALSQCLSYHCALFSFTPSLPWSWKDGLFKVRDYLTLTT
jgi:hypothetical protein